MSENHRMSGSEMDLRSFVAFNLYDAPESFDCFFGLAWDGIDTEDQDKRKEWIMGLFPLY